MEKFGIHMPLLLENITFEGPHLVRVPLLEMEDWDLDDHERFPHLAMENYMKHVSYKEFDVTMLEPVEWICRVSQSGLLNLLWVPHYHHSNINIIYINQLLTLVHDGCLWLGVPIPIIDMLIHIITLLLHEGLNLAKASGRKTSEHDLAKKMKVKSELIKKSCGYSIKYIDNPVVKILTQILAGKVMRKCRTDEVPASVILLATQCAKGVQFNWSHYLCSKFLANFAMVKMIETPSTMHGCCFLLCWLLWNCTRTVTSTHWRQVCWRLHSFPPFGPQRT